MGFDETKATNARLTRALGGTVLEWDSSEPEGTVFQVYIDGILAASTTSRFAILPPGETGRTRIIIVGAVGDDEAEATFEASLPASGLDGNRARLAWYGGRYLDEGLAGFRIYRAATAGGAVSYGTPVADLGAFPFGLTDDGAGRGRAGKGRAGRAEQRYTWVSDPLPTGVWRFGVRPYDRAGNEAAGVEINAEIIAPPAPPVADALGRRIGYVYNSGTRIATLTWS